MKKDFLTYSQLVRKGGIIVFHDVAHHEDPSIGVDRSWLDSKRRYTTKEIVHDPEKGWRGIALLFTLEAE